MLKACATFVSVLMLCIAALAINCATLKPVVTACGKEVAPALIQAAQDTLSQPFVTADAVEAQLVPLVEAWGLCAVRGAVEKVVGDASPSHPTIAAVGAGIEPTSQVVTMGNVWLAAHPMK